MEGGGGGGFLLSGTSFLTSDCCLPSSSRAAVSKSGSSVVFLASYKCIKGVLSVKPYTLIYKHYVFARILLNGLIDLLTSESCFSRTEILCFESSCNCRYFVSKSAFFSFSLLKATSVSWNRVDNFLSSSYKKC